LQHQRKIIGMHRLLPFPTLGGGRLHSRVVQPALVAIINGAIGPRRPDDLWDRLGQQAKALLALAQRLAAGGMLHKKTDARAHCFHKSTNRSTPAAASRRQRPPACQSNEVQISCRMSGAASSSVSRSMVMRVIRYCDSR